MNGSVIINFRDNADQQDPRYIPAAPAVTSPCTVELRSLRSFVSGFDSYSGRQG